MGIGAIAFLVGLKSNLSRSGKLAQVTPTSVSMHPGCGVEGKARAQGRLNRKLYPGESLPVLSLEQHILSKFSDLVQATEIKLIFFCPYHRNGFYPLTFLKYVFIYSMYR